MEEVMASKKEKWADNIFGNLYANFASSGRQ